MTNSLRFSLAALLLAAIPATARADDGDGDDVAPISGAPDGLVAVSRGVQLPGGMLSARVMLGVNLSKDLVGKPISLVPDISYGISDRLQVSLVHSGLMRWQSRPGLGLCLTGKSNGCPQVYDNVGVDVMYGLVFGKDLHLSVHGGLYLNSFDPLTTMVAVGAAGKAHFGARLALAFDPQLGIALSDRDVNDDGLALPLELQYQLNAASSLKVLSGVTGSLSAFGDTLEVPLGVGLSHNLSEHLDLAARFSFDNLLGHHATGVGAADARSLAVLLAIRA